MKPSKLSTAKVIIATLALTGLICANFTLSLSGKDPARAGVVSGADRSWLPKSAQLAKLDAAQVSNAYAKLPLMFESNTGQTDSQVKFISRGSGYGLFLTSTEAVLKLMPARTQSDPRMRGRDEIGKASAASISKSPSRALSEVPDVIRMRLVGANLEAQAMGQDELPGKSNYFIGNEPNKWRTNIPNYGKVKYQSIYPGVDLLYYGTQGQLEYDFILAPSADPGAILLGFSGSQRVELNGAGELVLRAPGGELRLRAPLAYQEINGRRQAVAAGYEMLGGEAQVGFALGPYDADKPLVIDPMLAYSSYLGVSGADGGSRIAVDTSGSAYVTGFSSSDFPTTVGAFDTTLGGDVDIFVTKLNAAGNALVYSTFLGGSAFDRVNGIAVNASGSAYVIGLTSSADFPTTAGAFDTTLDGFDDAFVTRLNAAGTALVYSTYLGGSDTIAAESTLGNVIAVDAADSAYVTGYTFSADFPTTAGAFDTTLDGPGDAFVTKVNAAGTALIYSTYLGGSGDNGSEEGTGIAVDAAGSAYVIGGTRSADFPTSPGAFDTTFDEGAAFVTKLNAAGTALVYSTYLGDGPFCCVVSGFGIAVDPSGSAYVTGQISYQSDFPTTAGAFDTTLGGGGDAFVTKLNAAGTALIYSTYLGGSLTESARSIAIDASGNAYVSGKTSSSDFPTTAGAFDTTYGGDGDVFVTKLNAAGTALVYSTYLGGGDEEFGFGIAVDAAGSAYVTGDTTSPDFPTTAGALNTILNGGSPGQDAFVTKITGGGDTLTGTDVTVPSGNVTTSFSNVAASGITTVELIDPASAGTLPGGFTLTDPPVAFEIQTSATVSGPIQICFYVPSVNDPTEFSSLRILHNEGGTLTDRTILPPDSPAPDFAARNICARVDSLSPFLIARIFYNFTGFFQPVDNFPTINVTTPGSAIPVKFSLGGNKGLNFFAAGYPASQQIACSDGAPVATIEETVAAGGSSLSYDATTDQYKYVWKTNKAWKGMCRQLILKLNDGTSHIANVQFK